MKKAILALAFVMSIGATQVSLASSAPKHRYHPTTQQVDSKAAPASAAQPSASKDKDDEALEAYSDTTSTDSANYDDYDENDNKSVHSRYSLDNYDDPFDFIGCYKLVYRAVTDPDYVKRCELRIRENYVPYTWTMTAAHISEIVDRVADRREGA